MVFAAMADSSEREELEKLIEGWNASRLDMFTMSKPDANLAFFGNMRFYFQEPGAKDTKVATRVLRVSSSDTTDEVMKVLVSKFHPDMKMLTMPNYSLYEVHETGAEAHKLELDQRPLYVQLYWQREDRDGRFLLKSDDDLTTKKLFEEEGSARKPDKKKFKKEQSKRFKDKKKGSQLEEKPKNLATELYDAKPVSSLTRSKSNPEAVMKIQRKKKLEDRLKKLQEPETSGGGGGPLRIFAESLQPENPYKTILCGSNDTTETVLKDALEKYEVPSEEMDQYCLTMVTITPGNHSDPESSSGIKERVVPDHDCPAAIAASWPEASGELRFYLKKKENMPKRKQPQARKRRDEAPLRAAGRPGVGGGEQSPLAIKETTFDVTPESHSPTEKDASSPAVHVVDVAQDLPATLEFRESGEDAFFAVVVSEVNGTAVNFKLAPTFTLYMCCRYRLSPKFRPDFSLTKRREKVTITAKKVANMMWQTVKENNGMAGHLAFWMANSSEFLNFLKQDMDLSGMTEESQKILAHTTQQAFRSLVQCIKAELQTSLPAFLDPSEEGDLDEQGGNGVDDKYDPMEGYQSTERSFKVRQYGAHGQPLGGDQWMGKRKKVTRPVVGDVLHTLKAAMALLRRCRVNPALTIQLFSQVFHYINMWLFNRIVLEPQLRLCTRAWGTKLRERLDRLQAWAESQGLELAAECHLGRIRQAALLLHMPKQDSTVISSNCFKLNSLQLRQILELYQPERDEPAISLELIEKVVSVAASTADETARKDGQKVLLEEEPELYLPFLLPDDGYNCEKIRGVPPGLKEFLDPLITPGLCRLTIQPKASGLWTVHFKIPAGSESPPLEVVKVSINKGNRGMGVSVVGAKGAGQEHFGIYVKEVIDGGPAFLDGRLKPGDQILEVNGETLVGVQQEDAVKILLKAGAIVNITIAKRAVYKHGLVELLSSVAPVQKTTAMASPNRSVENKNLSPVLQQKEIPRPLPRYRLPPESPQRSSPAVIGVQYEADQKPVKLEQKTGKPEPPPKRRNPYDRCPSHDHAEQPHVQTKTVVQYQMDEPPSDIKHLVGVKTGVPLPYANPQEIQKRQREMQLRKVEDQDRDHIDGERREQERVRKVQEEREEAERVERTKREEFARQEQERIEREKLERLRIDREQQERLRIEREQQERLRIEREKQERQRMEREQQERLRIERDQQERQRIERERQERERLEKEKQERQRIEQERQRREREDLERTQREEWEKREREESERRREEEWKTQQEETTGLDERTRRERELEMMLERHRLENENRLKELERQMREEREEAERIRHELMESLRREREERKEPHRMSKLSVGSTVHYVNDKTREKNEDMKPSRPVRAPTPAELSRNDPRVLSVNEENRVSYSGHESRHADMRATRPGDYNKRTPTPAENRNDPRPPLTNEENRRSYESIQDDIRASRPIEYNKRGIKSIEDHRGTPPSPRRFPMPTEDSHGSYGPGKRFQSQNFQEDSFDMDPAEVERQFQQRLAQEASGKSEVDGVRVIRVPGQQESRGRDVEDRPRARVDWQREEEERNRKEQKLRREQDEQLVRDFQQSDAFRQPPAGAVAEPLPQHQGDWEKDEELRRQREEEDRLREARANQLRNRIIDRPEDDEELDDSSQNGRGRRVKCVKFASVRTEISQPSSDPEAKSGHSVKFVHDGKVEDTDDDDEEFPDPPPPIDEEDEATPMQDQIEYYQRPPPPPKPEYLMGNGSSNPPEFKGGANPPYYSDNEHVARARVRLSDDGYATHPGRSQQNNNQPVPKPRGGVSTEFAKSPSPDNAKLPFREKMKVFNDNTPPKRQTASKWEQRFANGGSL